MPRLWDAIKYIFFMSLILLILRGLLSERLFGPMNIWVLAGSGIFAFAFIIFSIVKYYPLIKISISKRSHLGYMKDLIKECMENNIPIPATLGENLHDKPPYRISTALGEEMQDYFLQFKDKGVMRNFFYDGRKKAIRTELIGDELHSRPSEAVKIASVLNQYLKLGVPPKTIVSPAFVERVIETVSKQPEGKEEKEPK